MSKWVVVMAILVVLLMVIVGSFYYFTYHLTELNEQYQERLKESERLLNIAIERIDHLEDKLERCEALEEDPIYTRVTD